MQPPWEAGPVKRLCPEPDEYNGARPKTNFWRWQTYAYLIYRAELSRRQASRLPELRERSSQPAITRHATDPLWRELPLSSHAQYIISTSSEWVVSARYTESKSAALAHRLVMPSAASCTCLPSTQRKLLRTQNAPMTDRNWPVGGRSAIRKSTGIKKVTTHN